MAQTYSQRVLDLVKAKHSHEKEFIQAVQEVLSTIEPVLAANSKYKDHAILERIVEPERTILFRVPWIDDQGKVQVNRGYRVNSTAPSDRTRAASASIPASTSAS